MEPIKDRLALFLYSFLGLTVVIFLIMHTPIMNADSGGYVGFDSIRPPLYSIFIALFKWVGHYQIKTVMWIQSILICASLVYAREWLKRNLLLSDIFIALGYAIITFHLFFALGLLGTIMSESLAFPLFVMGFFTLIDCVREYQTKKLMWFALWATLLILTRLQFYFLYVIYPLLLVWYLTRKVPLKKIATAALIFLIATLCAALFVRSCNFIVRGSFTGITPSLGQQLIVQPLYLANPDAEKYFTNAVQKKFVHEVMKDITQNDLGDMIANPALSPNLDADYDKVNPRFTQAVTAMRNNYHRRDVSFWGPEIPARSLLFGYYCVNFNPISLVAMSHSSSMSAEAANQLMTNVSIVLFLHEFKRNLAFIIYKWVHATGGWIVLLPLITMLLVAFTRLVTGQNARGSTGEITQIFIMVSIVLIFANNGLISIPQVTAEGGAIRYSVFNYFSFYCLVTLIINRLFVEK